MTKHSNFKSKVSAIANSSWFSNLMTGVIVFYALLLGFRTFHEISHPYKNILDDIDLIVTGIFILEVILKMMGEKKWTDYFKDNWNRFDFIVVALSVIPTGHADLALAARILRVFRVLRLINKRPDLKRIIDTVFNSITAIADIAIIIFIVMYIYAVVGTIVFQGTHPRWDNVLTSFLTMFQLLVVDNWPDRMAEVRPAHPHAWIFFVSFFFIGVAVFMNLFTAIFIDKIKSGRKEEEAAAEEPKVLDRVVALLTEQDQMINGLKAILDKTKATKNAP